MKLLLDTHVFVWWAEEIDRLSPVAYAAIEDASQVFVSLASAWEIAIKVGNGRWPEATLILNDFEGVLAGQRFDVMPISLADVRRAGLAPAKHRDPFDRLLAAQAVNHDVGLVTSDRFMASLGARTVW